MKFINCTDHNLNANKSDISAKLPWHKQRPKRISGAEPAASEAEKLQMFMGGRGKKAKQKTAKRILTCDENGPRIEDGNVSRGS